MNMYDDDEPWWNYIINNGDLNVSRREEKEIADTDIAVNICDFQGPSSMARLDLENEPNDRHSSPKLVISTQQDLSNLPSPAISGRSSHDQSYIQNDDITDGIQIAETKDMFVGNGGQENHSQDVPLLLGNKKSKDCDMTIYLGNKAEVKQNLGNDLSIENNADQTEDNNSETFDGNVRTKDNFVLIDNEGSQKGNFIKDFLIGNEVENQFLDKGILVTSRPFYPSFTMVLRAAKEIVRRFEIMELKRWVKFEGFPASEIQQPPWKRSLKLLGNGRKQNFQCPEGILVTSRPFYPSFSMVLRAAKDQEIVRRFEKLEQKRWVKFEGFPASEIQQPPRKRSLKLLGNGRKQNFQCPEESPPLGAVKRGRLEKENAKSCPQTNASRFCKSSNSCFSISKLAFSSLILLSLLCFSHGHPIEMMQNDYSENYMRKEPFDIAYVHTSRVLEVLEEIYGGQSRHLDVEKIYDIPDYDKLHSQNQSEWIPLNILGEMIVNPSKKTQDVCGEGKILLKKFTSCGTVVSNNLTEWTDVQICIDDPLKSYTLKGDSKDISPDIYCKDIILNLPAEEFADNQILLFCSWNNLNFWCNETYKVENFYESFTIELLDWLWPLATFVIAIVFSQFMYDQEVVLSEVREKLCGIMLAYIILRMILHYWENKDENVDESNNHSILFNLLYFAFNGSLPCWANQQCSSSELGHSVKNMSYGLHFSLLPEDLQQQYIPKMKDQYKHVNDSDTLPQSQVTGSDELLDTNVNGSDELQESSCIAFRRFVVSKDAMVKYCSTILLGILLILSLLYALGYKQIYQCNGNIPSPVTQESGPVTQESGQTENQQDININGLCRRCEDESSYDDDNAYICINKAKKITPENIEKSKELESHERLTSETYGFYENICSKHEQLPVATDEIQIHEPKVRKAYIPIEHKDRLFAKSAIDVENEEVEITTKKFADMSDDEDFDRQESDEIKQDNDESINNEVKTDLQTYDFGLSKERNASIPKAEEVLQDDTDKKDFGKQDPDEIKWDNNEKRHNIKRKTVAEAGDLLRERCHFHEQKDNIDEKDGNSGDKPEKVRYDSEAATFQIAPPYKIGTGESFHETQEDKSLPSNGCMKKENHRFKVIPAKKWDKETTQHFKSKDVKKFSTFQNLKYSNVNVGRVTKKCRKTDVTLTENELDVWLQVRDHSWLPINELPVPKIDLTVALITQFEPLMKIIDLIAAGTPPTPHVSMRYELLRFCTLRSYPKEDKPYIIKLAVAGFYYASDGDGVVCYCCGVRRYNWTAEDIPGKVHERINPSCKFLRKNEEVNVPVQYFGPYSKELMAIMDIPEPVERPEVSEDVNNDWAPERVRAPESQQNRPNQSGTNALGINTAIPKHSQYATKTAREASYTSWPVDSSHTPHDLANAGFFYAGFGDCVRCFYCGIGLRHWTSEDDAWIEHARWSRNCVFVKQKKGDEFINLVQMAVQYAQDNNTQAVGTAGEQQQAHEVERMLLSDAAQSVLDMGYQPIKIKSAIEQIITQNRNTKITAQLLMEKVLEIEESGNTAGGPPVTSAGATATHEVKPSVKSSTTEGEKAGEGDKPSSKLNASKVSDKDKSSVQMKEKDPKVLKNKIETEESNEETQDPKEIKKENEQLKEQTLCKVCLDNTVSIVFLPCGHLVTCADCAPAMRKCPICRALVKGTVRTYMS